MKTIDDLTQELIAAAQKRLAAQIETARHDYQEGMNDCKNANNDFENLLMVSFYRIDGDSYEAHITLILSVVYNGFMHVRDKKAIPFPIKLHRVFAYLTMSLSHLRRFWKKLDA